MNSIIHPVAFESSKEISRMQNKSASSITSNHNLQFSERVSEVTSMADIVALDHSYCFPRVAEVFHPNHVKKQPEVGLEDGIEMTCNIDKPDMPMTDKPSIISEEEIENPPQTKESPVSINYIFHVNPELPPKNISITNRSSQSTVMLTNIKSGSTSPTMSKLERLLKNQCRSSSSHISRRSPSSFLSPSLNYRRCKKADTETSSPPSEPEDDNIDIDVESVDPDPVPPYDINKANNLMKDCEKYLNFLRQTNVPADWEEQIVKTGWTISQRNVFEDVLKALHQERLSRLVNQNRSGEPVLRRLSIDKTSQRIRKVLASFKWNTTLTQWLHGVLVENLSFDYLSAYFDVLQTLRVILPDLVDKMIVLTTGPRGEKLNSAGLNVSDSLDTLSSVGAATISALEEAKKRGINAEAINLVLKRKWDPFNSVIQNSKAKKQPNSPIFVFIAANPIKTQSVSNHRKKRFISLLAGRGKVVSVTLNMSAPVYVRLQYYMRKLLRVATQRVRELKRQYPGRPVFAVGWTSGSVLACKLSTIEPVAGVINFGYPLRGFFRRENLAVSALQSDSPSLFIIGGVPNYSSILDMEHLCYDRNIKTSLLIVGCASDELRISNKYRKHLLVTQPYVDSSIVDEILKFVSKFQVNVPDLESNDLPMASNTSKAKKKAPKLSAPSGIATDVKADDKSEKNITVCTNAVEEEGKPDMVFDFDGPKVIPSNTSSNKRKAYFRPTPSSSSCAEKSSTPTPCITASQLVQQSPGVKKRYSKPSGPNVPKLQNQVDAKPEPISPIQYKSSMQVQQSSAMSSITTDVGQDQPTLPKSVILNVLSTPSQVLRIGKEQRKLLSPEIPAPTRFIFSPEESTSVFNSTVDPGTEISLPPPMTLPSVENQTSKVANEHSVDAGKKDSPPEPLVLPSETKQTLDVTEHELSVDAGIATPPLETSVLPLENKIIIKDPTEHSVNPTIETPLLGRCALPPVEKKQNIKAVLEHSVDPGTKTPNPKQPDSTSEKKPIVEVPYEHSVAPRSCVHGPPVLLLQNKEKITDVSEHPIDPDTKTPLLQLPVVALQTKEIILKDASENPGSSEEADDSEPVVIAQIRPTSNLLINTSMITSPTILPGGATATPYIRTTVPTGESSMEIRFMETLLAANSVSKQRAANSDTPEFPIPSMDFVKGQGCSQDSMSKLVLPSTQTEWRKLPTSTSTESSPSLSEPRELELSTSCSTTEKETLASETKITAVAETSYASKKDILKNPSKYNAAAADKEDNYSDDEVQIVSELRRPSDPLQLSPSDIEDMQSKSFKRAVPTHSTGQIELAHEKVEINGKKIDEKGKDFQGENKQKSSVSECKVFGNIVKLEDRKVNPKRKESQVVNPPLKGTLKVDTMSVVKSFQKAVEDVREGCSTSSEMRSGSKKTEEELTRSTDREKPRKIKSSNNVSAKSFVPKAEKREWKCEKNEEKPPAKVIKTKHSPGKSSASGSPKSVNVAVKTASKVAMKAPIFFEKRKTLKSDSPASRTRNRSGSSSNATSTSTSQKSKAPTTKKKSRLKIKDDSESSDSSYELVEEVKQKQRGKPASRKNKKNTILSSESDESEGSDSCEDNEEEEADDEEIVPRVTRSSMKRQSVPGNL